MILELGRALHEGHQCWAPVYDRDAVGTRLIYVLPFDGAQGQRRSATRCVWVSTARADLMVEHMIELTTGPYGRGRKAPSEGMFIQDTAATDHLNECIGRKIGRPWEVADIAYTASQTLAAWWAEQHPVPATRRPGRRERLSEELLGHVREALRSSQQFAVAPPRGSSGMGFYVLPIDQWTLQRCIGITLNGHAAEDLSRDLAGRIRLHLGDRWELGGDEGPVEAESDVMSVSSDEIEFELEFDDDADDDADDENVAEAVVVSQVVSGDEPTQEATPSAGTAPTDEQMSTPAEDGKGRSEGNPPVGPA